MKKLLLMLVLIPLAGCTSEANQPEASQIEEPERYCEMVDYTVVNVDFHSDYHMNRRARWYVIGFDNWGHRSTTILDSPVMIGDTYTICEIIEN